MILRLRALLCYSVIVCMSVMTSGCDDPISYQGYQAPAYVPAIIPQYVTVDIRVTEQLTEAPSTRSEQKWQFVFSDAQMAADTANGESLISLLLHMQESEHTERLFSYIQLRELQFEMDRLAVFEKSSLMANSSTLNQSPRIAVQLQERWPLTDGPVLTFEDEIPVQLMHYTPQEVDKGTEAPDHLSMSFEIPQSKIRASNPALTYKVTGDIRLYY